MRKRTLLPALLSAIMVTAFSVPAITAAFAEGSAATTEKTKIVEIFNGNAENVSLDNKATATQDGETTVVSIPNDVPWSGGFILFKNPVDLTSAKEEGKESQGNAGRSAAVCRRDSQHRKNRGQVQP